MKVLLLKNVEHLGSRGNLVTVSSGYARNFLLPRKLATQATEGVKAYAERLKQAEGKRMEEEDKATAELAVELSKVTVKLVRRAGPDEKLFGSVTPSDVADALKAQGHEVDKRAVDLEEHIKAVGVFTVPIKLSAKHQANVKVHVVREAEKAG